MFFVARNNQKNRGIILPPKVGENEPEYVGMWHVDGHREDVAAVVLFSSCNHFRCCPDS